jgi:hypothetical protein
MIKRRWIIGAAALAAGVSLFALAFYDQGKADHAEDLIPWTAILVYGLPWLALPTFGVFFLVREYKRNRRSEVNLLVGLELDGFSQDRTLVRPSFQHRHEELLRPGLTPNPDSTGALPRLVDG